MNRQDQTERITDIEGIDLNKLKIVIRKNLIWIISIFLIINLTAYLTIRWTKDLYESESEMKLDIKQDATELGIKTLVEDQNLNIISGEIEQIKSKVFLNRVIDSLDINIGYYSIGKVLVDEKYRYSPIKVTADNFPSNIYDIPIYIDFEPGDLGFEIKLGENGKPINGTFGSPINLNGFIFTVSKAKSFDPSATDDYYFIIHSRESLLEYLSDNLTVEPLNFNANTIKITFKDFNALKAHTIVSKIDSLYINYSNEQKNLTNKQKIEWLNKELLQVESKMEDFESYFENFTLQNMSNNVDEDLKRTIFQINQVDSQRFELNKKLTELNLLIDNLSVNNPEVSINQKQFLPSYLNEDLEALKKLLLERNRLSLSYNENTFAFKQKENELNALKDQVFNQLTSLKKNWLERMSEMKGKKVKLEEQFASMPDKNTQFSKNQRFYKLYEEFYLSMMQSKAQFEIAQAGNTPDFKVLSPATLPTTPIAPQKLMILGIGFVASLVVNFFFIGILYLLNNKIISVQEVERNISVPVLGSIPVLRQSNSEPLIVLKNPKSMASEAIRTLRTSLDFFTSGGDKKAISVTSTISGEGKSFLAMNLSGVLAMSNKKVVLLDLDMRKAKENLPFAIDDPSKGVSTILINKHDWSECVIKTSVDSFDYIPAGPHPPNPSELLLNGTFSKLLDDLKTRYDFIVMDTPPVGLVTDGVMVMKRSDISIYVFRANYSKREFINNLSRVIKINKLDNVAVVVNALPSDGKAYGYGYYEEKREKGFFKKLLKI
ncbi:MAG TPA: polysaccharide biosynthesis tyrosine autokinase [Cyclobacteriaceae bacterium]|nr:polysaccharide biosynthesis tyrosine autokinase [Cyclobacteriaceae bacterium]HRK54331.1 polysaccharide biosynthesis tyrosine autokinase [Cyclobacteriaceae bacterium]